MGSGGMRRAPGPVLVAVLCLAEVLGLLGFGAYAALLPGFRVMWGLSNAEAGWIDGAFQAGYLLAVPVLVGVTDRIDACRIYLGASLLGAAASFGFALAADGLWSACLFRFLAGIGLAGTFMPGLKILSDRVEGAAQSRAVAFYTACFSLGGSLSVLTAGILERRFGWPAAFWAAGLGAAAAGLLAFSLPPPGPAAQARAGRIGLDFGPALRNRTALAYSFAYAAHMWELYGFRTWIVAFLTHVGAGAASTGATTLAAIILALGLPASVLGNEAALRFGRRRTIGAIMSASALVALGIGYSAALPVAIPIALCFLYSLTVSADSASLTAGAVASALPAHRGATMAMHSLLGFAAAALSPLGFGFVLDLASGLGAVAWGLAFGLLGLGVALGPIILRRLRAPAGSGE